MAKKPSKRALRSKTSMFPSHVYKLVNLYHTYVYDDALVDSYSAERQRQQPATFTSSDSEPEVLSCADSDDYSIIDLYSPLHEDSILATPLSPITISGYSSTSANTSTSSQGSQQNSSQSSTASTSKKTKRGFPRKIYTSNTRVLKTPEQRKPKKIAKLLNIHNIAQSSAKPCCEHHCIITNFSSRDILKHRKFYAYQTERQRSEFLVSLCRANFRRLPNDSYQWHVDGFSVCGQALKIIFGFSNKKLARCMKFTQDLVSLPPHGNAGRVHEHISNHTTPINWTAELVTHIEILVKQLGEEMPDSQAVHMPVSIKPAHLHEDFILSMKDFHDDIEDEVCLVNFYQLLLWI